MGKKCTLPHAAGKQEGSSGSLVITDPWDVRQSQAKGRNYFEEVGGIHALRRITAVFYDKVYEHPWLKKYFENVDKDHIASQQAEFMQGVLGGPPIYCGRTPGTAHPHIEITEKAFDLRQELLRQTLVELRVRRDIAEKWLALDEAFRKRLIKGKAGCKKRYGNDVMVFAPPLAR